MCKKLEVASRSLGEAQDNQCDVVELGLSASITHEVADHRIGNIARALCGVFPDDILQRFLAVHYVCFIASFPDAVRPHHDDLSGLEVIA